MDATATSLCMDNDLPIVVFDLLEPGNIRRVVLGEAVGWELYAGTVLVVAGSLLAQRAAFRSAPPEPRAPAAGSRAA